MAQAACSAVLIGCIVLAARVPAEGAHARDLLALALAASGVLGTAIADAQLARFKADIAEPRRHLSIGPVVVVAPP